MKKMYVLIRKDLDIVYSMVQGSHAVAKLVAGPLCYEDIPFVFLYVNNGFTLMKWLRKMDKESISYAAWTEPDLSDQLTAAACIQDGDFFKSLQLVR